MGNPYRHPISTPVPELQGVASIASTTRSGGEGDNDLDLSWVDIAVDWKRNVSIIAFSPGFADMTPEHHWEDMFDADAPEHLEPGAYRWSGFTVIFSDEDAGINARGGNFQRLATTPSSDAPPDSGCGAGKNKRKCLTPGFHYVTNVSADKGFLDLTVIIGKDGIVLAPTKSDAEAIQDAIHDALEPIVASMVATTPSPDSGKPDAGDGGVERLREGEWFYPEGDHSSDECRFSPDEVIDYALEGEAVSQVVPIERAASLPTVYAAVRVYSDAEKDLRGSDDEYDYTLFATADAARAALVQS